MSSRVLQPSLAGGEIGPALYGRVDLEKYGVSLRRCRNFLPQRTGGVTERPGLEFLGEVQDSTKLPALIEFRFNTTTQVCLLEFGERVMRVWHQGALVQDPNFNRPLVVMTPFTAAQAREMSFVQFNDVIYFAHRALAPHKLSRHSWTDWRFAAVDFQPACPAPAAPAFQISGQTEVAGGDAISYKVTAVHPDTGEESLPCEKIIRITGPKSTEWTTKQEIALQINARATYSGSGVHFRFYKAISTEVYGFIGEATHGDRDSATLVDRNITPDVSRQPPDGYNPFASAGNYPSVVAIHQQRLVFAATDKLPHGLWLSRTGFFENMSRSSPPRDDDSITAVIASGEANEIRGVVSLQDLLVLTSGSENVVNGGATGAALTPTTMAIKPQSFWGTARIKPLVTGNTVLFVQSVGHAVRDFGYEYSVDGFSGSDRTVLAAHLLEGRKIVAWAYAQSPDSVFWMVRDDGKLLSLSYFREQEIGAWALHATDGSFENVAVIPGADRHEVYVVVRRSVGGRERRFLERFAPSRAASIEDARFFDSYLTYNGAPVDSVGGLDHLEGREVHALVDGSPVYGLTVSGGRVDLGRMGENVVVGLAYPADETCLETLPVDLGLVQGKGSAMGRRKTVSHVTLCLRDSREFEAGPGEDDSERAERRLRAERRQRVERRLQTGMNGRLRVVPSKTLPEVYDGPAPLFTGVHTLKIPADWTRDGRVLIHPVCGLPLQVLAIGADIDLGD